MNSNSITTHQLTTSSFFLEAIENADEETFDGIHRHDFFELIWFTKAVKSSSVNIDFITYDVVDNMLCILSPGQIFQMEYSGEQGYVMAFSKTLFDELTFSIFQQNETGSPQLLAKDSIESLHTLMGLIKKEKQESNRIILLKSYLTSFLIHILSAHSDKDSNDLNRINRLIKLIDEHYLQQKDSTFYASYFNITPKRLNEISKKLRNATIKELLAERTLLEAKREINFGKLSIKEIAYKLGFKEPAYFSRYFKSKTGMTTSEFKASLQTFIITHHPK